MHPAVLWFTTHFLLPLSPLFLKSLAGDKGLLNGEEL